MSDLHRLYFGRDDAESDIAEGGLLRAGFLKTAAYDAALSGKKRLIIGRKGSGKSAICMTLASANGDGYVSALVTPDAMSLDEIRRYELQGVTDELAKSLFWRYILGLQIAKYAVAHGAAEHKKTFPNSVNTLRKFLIDNGEAIDPKLHEKFWRSIQRLRSLSFGAFGASMKLDLDAPSEALRTSNQLEVIERQVLAALSDLGCPDNHGTLLLLVDQLEQVWSNDSQSDAMVTGLLLASKHVASKFPRVRSVVFIRTDIYDILRFAERDKFRGDEMRIDWTKPSLLDVALMRARASVGRQLTTEELWDGLFPANFAGAPTSDYLVSRTLGRPRDLIQFANLCRDTAEKNGHLAVMAKDITEAEVQFSQWKLQDLAREYEINYPFLADLFILFQNSNYIVSRQTLQTRFMTRKDTLLRRFPDYASSLTLDGVIDILYGISFLGVRRKHDTVYSYQDSARVEPDECQFYIHPCFRQALRSATATNLHPYRRPAMIQEAGAQNIGAIGHFRTRADPEFELMYSLRRAANRLLSLLDDPDLPPEAAAEIGSRIHCMRDDTDRARQQLESDPNSVNLAEYVRWACSFMQEISYRLMQSSLGDDPRVRHVARTAEDEARRIARDAGIRLAR